MLIVKNYCLGSQFDLRSNAEMMGHIDEALGILEAVKDREALSGPDFFVTGSKLK